MAYKYEEKTTFKDIIFKHLSKILDLSCDEFRGGYWIKQIKGNFTEEVYVPDSRKKIIQAITYFTYLLEPHFTDDEKKFYKEIKLKLQQLKKDFAEKKINREEFIIKKLELTESLFEKLNFLLKKKDYFASEFFVDSEVEDDDEVIVEENEKLIE